VAIIGDLGDAAGNAVGAAGDAAKDLAAKLIGDPVKELAEDLAGDLWDEMRPWLIELGVYTLALGTGVGLVLLGVHGFLSDAER